MDKVTMKVMSSTCKMADITDQGVSCKNVISLLIFRFLYSYVGFLLQVSILCSGGTAFQKKGTYA